MSDKNEETILQPHSPLRGRYSTNEAMTCIHCGASYLPAYCKCCKAGKPECPHCGECNCEPPNGEGLPKVEPEQPKSNNTLPPPENWTKPQ